MGTITAQRILDENNWATGNISLVNLEYLIDNAIDYLNLMAHTTISNMTGGGTGAGTVTVAADESAVLKPLIALYVRAYLDRGPNISVGGLSVTSILSDPQYDHFSKLILAGIEELRGTASSTTARTIELVK